MMHLLSGRRIVGLMTAVFVAGVIAAAVLFSAPVKSQVLTPSAVRATAKPGTVLKVMGVVVDSRTVGGITRLTLADPSDPRIPVLEVEYAVTQRVSFGRGVVVIAQGSTNASGIFEASELVTKAPKRATT